jgi:hypothetical protein
VCVLYQKAFMEARALETLVKLAAVPDLDIRRNVAGAMYRLAMHRDIKRPFGINGALRPLTQFLRSEDRIIHRLGIMAVKELCENKSNRLVRASNTDACTMQPCGGSAIERGRWLRRICSSWRLASCRHYSG